MVLACEVGGRWSTETQAFLRQLAKAKARTEPVPHQTRARAAWLRRWMTVIGVQQCESVLAVSAGSKRRWVGEGGANTGSSAVWHEPPRVVRSRVSLFLM